MTDELTLIPHTEVTNTAVDDLLARVYAIPARRKARAWLIPIAITVALIFVMTLLGTAGYMDTPGPALTALMLIVGAGICIGVWAERRDMRAVYALAGCRDLRALGGLLDSSRYSNRRVQGAVQNALLELLPHLTPDNQMVLSMGSREALNTLLYGKSGELAMASLKAIERVGDGTALPYLTSIAAGKGIPSSLRDQRVEVEERAQNALSAIHSRIEMHNRAGTLLRASQMPTSPAREMLRPASDPLVTDALVNSRELLRPQISAEQDAVQKQLDQELDQEKLAGTARKEDIVD